MPLFDFHCRACGHRFEALVRPNGAPPVCASCRSLDLERLVSNFAVSSAERRQAAANKSRTSQRAIAARDSVEIEREAEQHRKEEH